MAESSSGYVIKAGADGRERHRVPSRIVRPTTLPLLDRVGLASGGSCVDLGCGGGDVCVELSRLVDPAGRVLGLDMDAETIAIAEHETADFRGFLGTGISGISGDFWGHGISGGFRRISGDSILNSSSRGRYTRWPESRASSSPGFLTTLRNVVIVVSRPFSPTRTSRSTDT
jgi:SAM-dependent methyltransferase